MRIVNDKPAPNVFTAKRMDRAAHLRKDADWLKKTLGAESARFIPVSKDGFLLSQDEPPKAALLTRSQSKDYFDEHGVLIYLGLYDDKDCFAFPLSIQNAENIGKLGELHTLRSAGNLLDQDDAAMLAYAQAMIHWHRRHRYCGHCGTKNRSAEAGHVRFCTNPECGKSVFPRVDPAIIVLVSDADECLLGRQAAWPVGVYSTIAGFVEPGESLESAVAREVVEETGVYVDDVSYYSSQPWPFPSSLMLGFNAVAKSRDIHLHDCELEHADWFTREHISNGKIKLPSKLSIAYRLIENWYDSPSQETLAEVIQRHPPWR